MSAPRRVAITGAAGYLGIELAQRCVADGAEVLGLDIRRPSTRWPQQAAFAVQDVTDESLHQRLADFRRSVKGYEICCCDRSVFGNRLHYVWPADPPAKYPAG